MEAKRGVVRVKSWEEFKQLAIKFHPSAVAYNVEQSVPARELTSLRLIIRLATPTMFFLIFRRMVGLGKRAFRFIRINMETAA